MASWHADRNGSQPGPEHTKFDWWLVHLLAVMIAVPWLLSPHLTVRIAALACVIANAVGLVEEL